MPHQCTNCSRTFIDGSKEMLSGCPDCGGNKFQFLPSTNADVADDVPPERPEAPPMARTAMKATATVRQLIGTNTDQQKSDSEDFITAEDSFLSSNNPSDHRSNLSNEKSTKKAQSSILDREDRAQADARSDIVHPDELPPQPSPPTVDEESEKHDERMSLAELREELNDQFESIKIVDKGTYELNLMELYEREEYIISLQENGRYVIEVPESVYGRSDR